MDNFVHLHTHTEKSTLDGMSKIRELLETAKSLGQPAIAITDHGTSAGLWEAQKIGDEIGIKVIHGQEFYYERENDGKNGHLLVLAKNDVGLRNIFKMQEYAWVHNFYYKPRINFDILRQFHEGLIVTSACLGSTFSQYIINGDMQKAKEWAKKFQDLFGEDFYIEIQPNDIYEQHIVNEGAIRIAKQLGIDIVATNDVHYTFQTDDFAHEVLLALQINKKMSDENRWKFPDNNFWLKSREEMEQTFTGVDESIVREALDNTLIVADKCNARIQPGRYLPQYYDIPEGMTASELLEQKVMEGVKEKNYEEHLDDIKHELKVIDEEGYSDYFLIVQDYINTAREQGVIIGDGRGSGSGSKVGYVTNIHQIAPHEFDLLFERFMAHGREPDIDTDFSDQDKVFNDLRKKYGVESVARIATYGRMTPKNAIRKVLNAFEVPSHEISAINALVSEKTKTLKEAYEQSPELLDYKKKYPTEWEVIERLEGIISHVGKHAGGVVIYPNLSDYIPLITAGEDRQFRISAYDMNELAELGFYKFDILGLETVETIYHTLKSIEETTGKVIDLSQIDYEDPKVYDMLCKGDVSGVFQISEQATKVIEQQPRNFRDLIAINALIRPGIGDWEEYIARRRGKPWDIYEPRRPYMEETEGIITYQEQFLLDAHHLAGWDIAYADKHIRKNKDIRNDKELRNKFISDGERRGHSASVLADVWAEIEEAVDGGYSFNKSHSASYARLSYQTAWLKCHYPEHFYASLMSSEGTDGDAQNAIAQYIVECKERGIQVLPPDINNSGERFVVANGGINYRITAIRHVGDSAIHHIEELRPIKSFQDFLERREKKYANKAVIVNLIKAGAFDFDNPNRAELLWQFDMSERTKTQVKEGYECPRYEWNDKIKAEWEKEVLGMYLSTHPMEKYGFKPLSEYEIDAYAMQGGEVVSVFEFHPKKNPQNPKMAFVTIDTLFGQVKVVVFANMWARQDVQSAMQVGNIVLIKGKRSGNDILLNEFEVLENA